MSVPPWIQTCLSFVSQFLIPVIFTLTSRPTFFVRCWRETTRSSSHLCSFPQWYDEEFNLSIHLEKPSKVPLWKEFKVPLLYKDGNEQLDDNAKDGGNTNNGNKQLHNNINPVTIIVRYPKLLHFSIFMTNCNNNGGQYKTCVVEIVDDNPCKWTYEMWNEWRKKQLLVSVYSHTGKTMCVNLMNCVF